MKVFDLKIYPGQIIKIQDIPVLQQEDFYNTALEAAAMKARIVSYWGKPEGGSLRLFMVMADDNEGLLGLFSTFVKDKFRSLTQQAPQANLFEREIAEQHGVVPEGHPWLKPVRVPYAAEDFFNIKGEEVHEVAVGPVHAGIIEPGHFRFQCHGEHVFNLEISLGYQHRGIERSLLGGPDKKTIHYMETAAGDTTIGHALAYCQSIETLSNCNVPLRGLALRGIMLELERLANHTGYLGALAGDIGYLPAASYCGRLRGDFLNMTALICGNRFGRNMIIPGGTAFDINDAAADELIKKIDKTFKDVKSAVNLLWDSTIVMDRFEDTGRISQKTALELGLVGPAARACGVERDARFDFPSGIYKFCQLPVSTCGSGDVFARASVRWLEIQRSVEFIKEQIEKIPEGEVCSHIQHPGAETMAVSLVEGWRGEICHALITDGDGKIAQYKIVDPSFHNWAGLEMALRGAEISDFPLCNKSFNLSYCGHDL